jgi:hypothetical protein
LQIDAGESLKKARRFKKHDPKPKATDKRQNPKHPKLYSIQSEAKENAT